eukprot:UN15708
MCNTACPRTVIPRITFCQCISLIQSVYYNHQSYTEYQPPLQFHNQDFLLHTKLAIHFFSAETLCFFTTVNS